MFFNKARCRCAELHDGLEMRTIAAIFFCARVSALIEGFIPDVYLTLNLEPINLV